MALRDLVVTRSQGQAMRIIYLWLIDKSGRRQWEVLRDLIARELEHAREPR